MPGYAHDEDWECEPVKIVRNTCELQFNRNRAKSWIVCGSSPCTLVRKASVGLNGTSLTGLIFPNAQRIWPVDRSGMCYFVTEAVVDRPIDGFRGSANGQREH